MKLTGATPSLVTGFLGLGSGVITLAGGPVTFAAVAGVLALASGVAGLQATKKLNETKHLQNVLEKELETVKNETKSVREQLLKLKDSDIDDQSTEQDFLIDTDTGLFSENFFNAALESRIASARRHLRPISVIIFDVSKNKKNDTTNPAEPSHVADAIKKTLREADTACLLQNGHYVLVLEDTPETGAVWTIERIRRALDESNKELTVWAGVACYPAHAFSKEGIVKAAEDALVSARDWNQDRIEIAAALVE